MSELPTEHCPFKRSDKMPTERVAHMEELEGRANDILRWSLLVRFSIKCVNLVEHAKLQGMQDLRPILHAWLLRASFSKRPNP